jgi:hypothetical protein
MVSVFNWPDPKGRATGRVIEGWRFELAAFSFEKPAAPAAQDEGTG